MEKLCQAVTEKSAVIRSKKKLRTACPERDHRIRRKTDALCSVSHIGGTAGYLMVRFSDATNISPAIKPAVGL